MNGGKDWFRWLRDRGWTAGANRSFQQEAWVRSLIQEAKSQRQLSVPLQELTFIVVDLETTGFRPHHGDEIIAIGAVKVEKGKVVPDKRFHTLVRPQGKIPDVVVRLTGITEDAVKSAPSLANALQSWLEFTGSNILVAYGAGLDASFLKAGLKKTWGASLQHRFLDVWLLARWLHPSLPDHSLERLLHRYGIALQGRHTADGDAWMTAQLWEKMLNDFQDHHLENLGQLYAALNQSR
ncbi:exonuclease domain-containing protein [Desmospora profundinema]|uniref:DNA polymerase-3 subunit epsilon n=1 Tax=Desmospora profundinema TaxID=1571184 RepID=A0ABU1IHQ0_9BACL|nr:exonuclease domain-containing protein [Desmospora profundinema]MDR6224295.1 DNA polymerase-3 subunit epsilon [Desmospora profundinema]